VQPVADGPAYKRVADDLRAKIRSGQLPAGTRLPSLAQLGQRYDVSGDVARQAISILRAEGLVETKKGSGATVRTFAQITRSSPGRLARARWGAGKAIQDHDTGQRWRTVDIVVSEPGAPSDIAEALGIEAGSPVISRARRFLVDDRPVQLATSYYPVDIARGTAITYTDTGPGGTYARLAEMGYAPVRFTETVNARVPDENEAFDLALQKTRGIVYDVTRYAFTVEDRCVEVNRMVLDASAYVLEYHFNA
jgi:GntR family transcriptional regulator